MIRRRVMMRRWIIAAVVAAAAAVPITSSIIRFSGLEQSTWMRIIVDAEGRVAPAIRVSYGTRSDQVLPVIWDNSPPRAVIGLKTDLPVKLLAVETDRGPAAPWQAQAWAPHWERLADPPALLLRGSGILDFGGSFQRFTLTFEPSNATVEIAWLDQHVTIPLAAHPGEAYPVTLSIPPVQRGWVLLPPIRIDRIAIRARGMTDRVAVREVTIHGKRWQTWAGSTFGDRLNAGAGIPLNDLQPLNHVSVATRASIWIVVTALLGGALLTTARLAARFGGAIGAYEGTIHWPLGRVMVVVTACAVLFHASYVAAVPPHFNFDSLGYYAFGRNFLRTHSFSSIATCRTPGYPAAIAASIGLFGDNLLPIVAAQHLAICALGAMVVWFLYKRVGPLWSGIGGLFVGVSPIMSLTANVLWTEALFMCASTAALLLFLYEAEPRPVHLAGAGVLAGVATMIRPNGVVIVALMVLWLFLEWWCDRSASKRVGHLVVSACVLLGTFALMTAPWIRHVHRASGHWALSDIDCGQAGQGHPVLATGLQPTNVFQLAGFVNLSSQSDAAAALPIVEPYKVFFRFFPARHRYHVERFVPWDLIYDDRLPGELLRAYVRAYPATYLRQVRDALVFNLTHRMSPQPSIFAYPDLDDVLDAQQRRGGETLRTDSRPGMTAGLADDMSWADAQPLLERESARHGRLAFPLRGWHLALNRRAMSLWGLIAGLGFAGCLVCLFVPGHRRLVVLGWHALVLVSAPAVLAMGADRYAMVAEPVFYVLAVVLLSVGVKMRSPTPYVRHRTTQKLPGSLSFCGYCWAPRLLGRARGEGGPDRYEQPIQDCDGCGGDNAGDDGSSGAGTGAERSRSGVAWH